MNIDWDYTTFKSQPVYNFNLNKKGSLLYFQSVKAALSFTENTFIQNV